VATLCRGGIRLRDQINDRFPKRDKRSDGWIGDTAHAGRVSDHNPDRDGIVHAIDIDENMGVGRMRNGRTAQRLADELVAYARSGLPGSGRVKYVVYENAIASPTYRAVWWKWRPGNWGHTAHIHVSFTADADNDGRAWPLPVLAMSRTQAQTWAQQLLKATGK
jgi:hypothetical protein